MRKSLQINNRVLLVSPSFEKEWRSSVVNSNSHYPLGLGYLHAYLEKNGYIVQTLFLNDYPEKQTISLVKSTLRSFKPAVLGLNMLTNNRVNSFRLIEHVHNKFPNTIIIIGGIHATLMYKQIIQNYHYVIAVIGEGEITAIELLTALKNNKSLRSIKGIAYWHNKKVMKNPDRELIKDLDMLPIPKHEAFFSDKRTIASILTSRGCPFNCSFCVLESISRRIYRRRSINNVIQELEYLISHFPQLETVWIHDDQFFLDNARVIEFCNKVIEKNIKLKFICSGRFKPVTKEMVEAIQKAGFIEVLFGLESGSTKVLELCNKRITKEDVVHTMRLFKKTDIFVVTFLIVGLYGETEDTIMEAAKFIQSVQKIRYIYYGDIGTLTIYPGTHIYDIAKNAGQIDDSYWMTDKPTPLFTVEHTENELKRLKHILLDHISLNNFFSLRGFVAQFSMIQDILGFIYASRRQIPMILNHLIQRFFPETYLKLKHIERSLS